MDTPPPGIDRITAGDDSELEKVVAALLAADPDGARFARTFRRTIDMLLDGQNTGRFRWEQLSKTEKTHAGTVVEINLQREFDFANGMKTDFKISEVDVDCKFSQKLGDWMVPPEALDQVCMVTWFNDYAGRWSAGLIRMAEHVLRPGRNRDQKRSLNPLGRESVRWLFRDAQLPENVLLKLTSNDISAIFASRSGQSRINELFRRTLGRRVGRTVVATVAQQDDYMKRVRYNGGARSVLASEGIVILGQYGSHVEVAAKLGLPQPGPGESVSVRLAPWTPDDGDTARAEIDGSYWRIARPGDPVCRAPKLPER